MMLIDKVYQTIRKYNMLKRGDKIVVGVSGGPDSVTLLHILLHLQDKMNLSLHIAHLNHKLRGKDSQEDARFVRNLAQKFNVPVAIKSVDVVSFAKKEGLTIEEAAREKRYEFLRTVANSIKATKIALGHNADDEVETILMWLIRGTGRRGLSGIPPVRKIDWLGYFDSYASLAKITNNITLSLRMTARKKGYTVPEIIRPLIETWRNEIKEYLKKHNLFYRTDTSNLNPVFMRNKIRLKLLPLIRKEYNPNFDSLLLQTAHILRDENQIIDTELDKILNRVITKFLNGKICLDLNKFLRYNIALERQIIRRMVFLFSEGKINLDYKKVENIIELAKKSKGTKIILLPSGLVIKKSYNFLEIIKEKGREKPEKHFNYQLNIPGSTKISLLGLTVEASIINKTKNFTYNKKDKFTAYLDLENINLPLFIRNRRQADRINPLGMKGYKKVKNFFIDHKIPPEERNFIPLICSENEVIWITGYPLWAEQISDKVKVTDKTEKILEIKLIPKNKSWNR